MTRNSHVQNHLFSSVSTFFSHQENLLPGLKTASFIQNKPYGMCLTLVNTAQFEKWLSQNKWQDSVTSLLNPEEQKLFATFSYPKRQKEWLGGRLAAKFAVIFLRGDKILPDRVADFSILPRENGAPGLRCPTVGDPLPCISISHSGKYAVGMAAYTKVCGVDIQKVTPQTIKVASRFAEPVEMNLLADRIPELSKTEQLSLLWSAKEALKKALLEDQPVIFQGVILQDLNFDRLLSLWFQFPGNNSRPAEVKGVLLDDYVLAFTVGNQNHA